MCRKMKYLGFCVCQAAVQTNSEDVLEIIQHVEKEVESGLWNVLGWWKASSTSTTSTESSGTMVKCHIVALEKIGGVKR
jgi:hypothetical protein